MRSSPFSQQRSPGDIVVCVRGCDLLNRLIPRLLLVGMTATAIGACGSSQGEAMPPQATASSPPSAPGPTSIAPSLDSMRAVFRMDFDGDDSMESLPPGELIATEHTRNGGSLERVDSHPGGGRALRFPAFAPDLESPRAGIIVLPGAAQLPNPGGADFSFGADVKSDDPWSDPAPNEATASNSSPTPSDPGSEIGDNGDNVIQRGLASEPTQFKLQTDTGRPSCAVTGSGGSLEVKGAHLEQGIWYRLRCDLTSSVLRLTVIDLISNTETSYEATGSVGDVDFAPDTPIAIGHKVTPEGNLFRSQPDQFNGTMDAVWVHIH